jgi:hypothetical protein
MHGVLLVTIKDGIVVCTYGNGCCGRMQDTLLPAQVLHRRSISSLDTRVAGGEAGGFLPHTALRRCLEAWVPLLIDECDFAAAFLLLYKPVDEVPGALAQDPFGPSAQGKAASLGAVCTLVLRSLQEYCNHQSRDASQRRVCGSSASFGEQEEALYLAGFCTAYFRLSRSYGGIVACS